MCTTSKSCVVMDFCQLQIRPSPKLVKKFIAELNVQIDSLLGLQIHSGCKAILEFTSPEAAATILNKPLVYQGNKIPIYLDDDAVDVYVHDLPLGMSNDDIVKAMSHYGQILTIRQERWKNYFPNVLNGVRMMRVLFKKPAPKYLTVMNKTGTVKCNGQKPICKLKAKKNPKQKEVNKQQDMNEDSNNKQQKDNNNNSNQQKQQQESSSGKHNNKVDQKDKHNSDNISDNNDNEEENSSLINEAVKESVKNNNNSSNQSNGSDSDNNEEFKTVLPKKMLKLRKRKMKIQAESEYYQNKCMEVSKKLNETKSATESTKLQLEQCYYTRNWMKNLRAEMEISSDED